MSWSAPYSAQFPLPRWTLFLRIAQAVFGLITLILAAYAVATLSPGYTSFFLSFYPGYSFAFFAFSWTVLYLPYVVIVAPRLPAKFNPVIITLALEFLSAIWWLVSFALLAKTSTDFGYAGAGAGARKHKRDDYYTSSGGSDGYDSSGSDSTDSTDSSILNSFLHGVAATKAAAAMGALEFALFAASFVLVLIAVLRKNSSEGNASNGNNNNNISTVNKEDHPSAYIQH